MQQDDKAELVKLVIKEGLQTSNAHMASVISFALAAIRGAFLLNGSAAVAVLAKQESITPFGMVIIKYGAFGAGLAVLCAGLSYVAQTCYHKHLGDSLGEMLFFLTPDKPAPPSSNAILWVGGIFHFFAAATFIGSLVVCFLALQELLRNFAQ